MKFSSIRNWTMQTKLHASKMLSVCTGVTKGRGESICEVIAGPCVGCGWLDRLYDTQKAFTLSQEAMLDIVVTIPAGCSIG